MRAKPHSAVRVQIAVPHVYLAVAVAFAATVFMIQAAQAAVIEAWVKRYNNVVSNANDQAVRVVSDASGNVVVTGHSSNGTNCDYYTAKYAAADGALLWEKRYNGPANGDDFAHAVAVDASGNVVVTGSSSNGRNDDYYTAKYAAADGALLWEKRYNGPANNDDRASAVALDGSGNVIVTGTSFGGPDGYADFYTAKYATANGALLWEKRLGDAGNSYPSGLAVDGSGNVVVTGSFDSAGFPGVSPGESYTVKYAAADGALLWEENLFDGYKSMRTTALAIDAGGDFVVTWASSEILEDAKNLWHYSQWDSFTTKYASNGAVRWTRYSSYYDGWANSDDFLSAVALDASGNVVVTGFSLNETNIDYYAAKYAAGDGALLWEQRYNGDGGANAVAVDASGNVVVTGSSSNGTNYDYYTAKYAAADGAVLWEKRYSGPADGTDVASSLALGPNGIVAVTGSSSGHYTTVVYREPLSPLSVDFVPAGVRIRFRGASGYTYQVQRASDVTGSWSTLTSLSAAGDASIEYTDTHPLSGQAFYRTAAAP